MTDPLLEMMLSKYSNKADMTPIPNEVFLGEMENILNLLFAIQAGPFLETVESFNMKIEAMVTEIINNMAKDMSND